jgi:hypothetical protein
MSVFNLIKVPIEMPMCLSNKINSCPALGHEHEKDLDIKINYW